MTLKSICLLAVCGVSLMACGGVPYRIGIEQGNIIDQQTLSGLRVGMPKTQVQQLLGRALLTDMFHKNRWDYVQYYKSGSTRKVQKGKVSLYFTNNLLSRIEADDIADIAPESVHYDTRNKNNVDSFTD